MNISLKPGPIISIWLPGFALTIFVSLSLHRWDLIGLFGNGQSQMDVSFWHVVVLIAIAFVVGQFLDAVRDVVLEDLFFDKVCGTVKWQFFFEADKASLDKLEEWFYTWYEMDANIVVAIAVAALLGDFKQIPIRLPTGVLMGVSAVFFLIDAKQLRSSTKEMIDRYYEKKM